MHTFVLQETPTCTPAPCTNPEPIPEPAIPASPTASLSLSPDPSSVEVQDKEAIAADEDVGASQELSEAEHSSQDQPEQQEEEQAEEEEEEAMTGGGADTILDLDDAPHSETILQVCVVDAAAGYTPDSAKQAPHSQIPAARCSRSAQCCDAVC